MNRTLYFAYGANTEPQSMARRCPEATLIGAARLDGYALEFKGVADIEPSPGNVLDGVAWWISADDERALDCYEGYPSFYTKDVLPVEIGGTVRHAMVYLMAADRVLSPPSTRYAETLAIGYARNGLPLEPLWAAIERSRVEAEEHGVLYRSKHWG